MRFIALGIPGAYRIEPVAAEDERGFFARTWCAEEFASHGLSTSFAQSSISFNIWKGTLRGMHYQCSPHEEAKLVRCTHGAIYDVLLDLRIASPTFLQWQAFELSVDNRAGIYIPEGCAHGFQTLLDGSEVLYQITVPYRPECARGVRWNDPAFNIEWPLPIGTISEKDARYDNYVTAN